MTEEQGARHSEENVNVSLNRRPARRRPGTRKEPEAIDTTPMLVGWTMALTISFVATMAITNIMTMSDATIAGTLTGISAVARFGITHLVRH